MKSAEKVDILKNAKLSTTLYITSRKMPNCRTTKLEKSMQTFKHRCSFNLLAIDILKSWIKVKNNEIMTDL